MLDKFFFSPTLKNRIDKPVIEKINKGFSQDSFNHISATSLNTKLVLSQAQEEPIFYAIQKAIPSSCLITVYYEQTGQKTQNWTGSGFLIQPGMVVTSNHVLPDENGASVIKVSFEDSQKYSAKVYSQNVDLDIGVLSIENKNIPPIPIAQSMPVPGEKIAVIGAPEGWENVVTVGYVSAVNMTPAKLPEPSWQDMIFIDADIYEGSSGSMVINSEGEVIGVVMGIIGKEAAEKNIGQNAVVPIYRVLDAIK